MSNGRIYKLSHCTCICQYHLVWTPKFRSNILSDTYIKNELKRIFKLICKWKGFKILAWHLGDEHIHIYLTIFPKYSIAYAVSIIKGKSSAWIKKKTKKFPDGSIWARGYFISTIGLNHMAVKKYIENQQKYQKELQTLF